MGNMPKVSDTRLTIRCPLRYRRALERLAAEKRVDVTSVVLAMMRGPENLSRYLNDSWDESDTKWVAERELEAIARREAARRARA